MIGLGWPLLAAGSLTMGYLVGSGVLPHWAAIPAIIGAGVSFAFMGVPGGKKDK